MSSEKPIRVEGVPINCFADVVSHPDPDASCLMLIFITDKKNTNIP